MPADPPDLPSPEQTRREFEQVCASLRAGGNPFYGRAAAEEDRRRLAAGLPPGEEAAARRRLAHALLRQGDNEQAIDELSRAMRLAVERRLPPQAQVLLLSDLGLAHLRAGEVGNCVGHHRPGMCVLPIGEAGQHVDPRGSKNAMRAFLAVLEAVEEDRVTQWLLNIAAMTVGQYPDGVPPQHRVPPQAMRSRDDIGRFRDVAHRAGLAINDTQGGGLLEDFDGDGRYDVMTSAVEPCTPMRFFRLSERGTFEDRAAEAGLEGQLGGVNLVHADVDNDGDRDVLVLRGGWFGDTGRIRNSLLLNDGGGRFADVTRLAGLADPAYPTQTAAFADYDLDGDLDLFVGNEGVDPKRAFPSQLFRNDGGGDGEGDRDAGAAGVVRFTDVAAAAGITNDRFAKGVAWGDYDNDGLPDLYVSNLGPNRLYRNLGDGTFLDTAPRLGLTEPAERSFATWFFDVDNDGWLDLFVADYSATTAEIAAFFLAGTPSPKHPRLYRNHGPGSDGEITFSEVGAGFGLGEPSLPMGANFGDLDNDGFLDIYLGTGVPDYRGLMPNLMYRNDAGRGFSNVTYSGGFGHLQKGHAVAFGDLDNDGDQDVFEQMGGAYPGDAYPSALYENPGHGHHWIQLELAGKRSNRDGIGCRIDLTVGSDGETRRIHRRVGTGGSFGGSPLRQEIGLGAAKRVRSLEVYWPASGLRQRFEDVAVDRRYRLHEGEDRLHELPVRPLRLGGPG